MRALSLLCLLFLSLSAEAAAADNITRFCPDLHRLNQAVKQCRLNPVFVKAANACMAKLTAEVSLQTRALALAMEKAGQNSAAAQAGKIANHGQNLATSRASLEALKLSAVQVREKLAAYRENMLRAGDVNKDLSRKLGKTFNSILESFPCYRDNHAAISRYINSTDDKISEISRALGSVGTLAERTGNNAALIGTDSASGLGRVRNGAAAVPAHRAPAAKKPASTITGDTKKAELPKK